MASPSLLNGPPRKDYAHIALQNQGSLQRSSKQFMRVGYNLSTTPVLPLIQQLQRQASIEVPHKNVLLYFIASGCGWDGRFL